MLRSVNEIEGYKILATDGEIGEVNEFTFDDQSWTIRYVVVATGGWLSGREVLLPVAGVKQPAWDDETLPVDLTKEQVKESPPIDLEQPVSRQMEADLFAFYRWAPYWTYNASTSGAAVGLPGQTAPGLRTTPDSKEEEITQERDEADPHLRSTAEVEGYDIRARDGEVGHVDGFLFDDVDWAIRYLVVDTRDVLPGRQVIISPTWVERVSWNERDVVVDLSVESIERSPEYDSEPTVEREYEIALYEHYQRPDYWSGS
jgi:hypothetical protein